jgi:hypothetical protein
MKSINSFLWLCAGANKSLIKRCPTDGAKYAGIGATIIFTGLLAALAAAFASYTIFDNAWTSILFGCIWGIMIFNLDRFIVSSSGKGDGTDAITWGELKSAFPRLFLAILLGLIISKPLELKIFEPEVNSKLQELQLKESQRRKELTESIFNADIDSAYSKIEKLKQEVAQKEKKRDAIADKLQEELAGRTGSGRPGEGPTAKQIRADMERTQRELADDPKYRPQMPIQLTPNKHSRHRLDDLGSFELR